MGKDYRLGKIFREYGEEFIVQYRPHPTVCRAIRAIGQCRTQRLGGLRVICKDCGCVHVVYASCSNRNCPICPALKKETWLLKREQELLPVKYYHVVFTFSDKLNDLCANHPRLMYSILFKAAWQSLKSMMGEEKWCGAQAGMLAVLHTWGQNLSHHPHLHCIVPAGGLSFDGLRWKACKHKSVLVDVKDLSALFQKTFMRLLRETWETEGIEFSGKAKKYEDLEEWRALFRSSLEKPWVVYAQAPSSGPKQTLAYLSRYTHSVAISEHRILELTEEKVKIRYKDYADEDEKGIPKKKTLKLKYLDFIKLFVKHILPRGFQKIRYFGFWAISNRKRKLAKCQALLQHVPLLLTMKAIKALVKQKLGIDPSVCTACQSPNLVTTILPAKPYGLMVSKKQSSTTAQRRAPPGVGQAQSLAKEELRA